MSPRLNATWFLTHPGNRKISDSQDKLVSAGWSRISLPRPNLSPSGRDARTSAGIRWEAVSGLMGMKPPFIPMTTRLHTVPPSSNQKPARRRLTQQKNRKMTSEEKKLMAAQVSGILSRVAGRKKAKYWGERQRQQAKDGAPVGETTVVSLAWNKLILPTHQPGWQ